jgi:predicted DNA binding protein
MTFSGELPISWYSRNVSGKNPAVLLELNSSEPVIRDFDPEFPQKFGSDNPEIGSLQEIFAREEGFQRFLEKLGEDSGTTNFRLETVSGVRDFEIRTEALGHRSRNFFLVEFREREEDEFYRRSLEEVRGRSLDLLKAGSREEVVEILLEIMEGLGYRYTVARLLHGKTLESAAATEEIDLEGLENHELESEAAASEAFRTGKILHTETGSETDGPVSILHVPLGSYGVMSIGKLSAGEFNDSERKIFRSLGEAVVFAVNCLKYDGKIFQDSAVELRLRREEPDFFLGDLVRGNGSECVIEEVRPRSGPGEVYYVKIEETEDQDPAGVLENLDEVRRFDFLDSGDGESLYSVVTASDTFFSEVIRAGGLIRRGVLDDEGCRVTVRMLNDFEKTRVFRLFKEEGWELFGKKEFEPSSDPGGEESLEKKLTEKQLKALKKAYRSGYYSYPRRCSAKEVASELGISDSTLFQHLQAAQRKLIEEHLEPGRSMD